MNLIGGFEQIYVFLVEAVKEINLLRQKLYSIIPISYHFCTQKWVIKRYQFASQNVRLFKLVYILKMGVFTCQRDQMDDGQTDINLYLCCFILGQDVTSQSLNTSAYLKNFKI